MRCVCSMQQNHPPGCLTYNLNLYCVPITLCLDGPDVQEGKRRSIARVTIALCLDGPSRLWLYMAFVMVSRVVDDSGGCPESELRST